jgi:hypothetical protein
MTLPRSFTDRVVEPAQVWGGLTTEARAGAIQLMARLAANLVTHGLNSHITEIPACHHESIIPKSAPSISIATP